VGGLIGGWIAWSAMQQAKARQAALDGASAEELEALASQGHSFRFRVEEVKARIDAASWWDSLSHVQGRLRVLHARKGEFKFQFLAMDEMQRALEQLHEALAERLEANVVLDRVKWRYVRKT
jgi:hypothetical protein